MKNIGSIMKKIVWFYILILPLLLYAYNDSDLDGVSDEHDLCPNTPLTDIVDMKGCTIEKLVASNNKTPQHFDIILGANYLDSDTLNSSFIFDYYYQDFSLQLQGTNYEEGGLGDTTLNLYYNFQANQNLSIRIGFGAIFPTYDSELDNNNLDYKALFSLNYKRNKFSLFSGLGYSIINDDDINSTNYRVNYQNSLNYYMGFGYFISSKFYSSLSYSFSSSIYKGGDDFKNISLYNYYSIDKNWFTYFGYTKGVTKKSNDQLYINLGYYF
jgi:hypothetical protein